MIALLVLEVKFFQWFHFTFLWKSVFYQVQGLGPGRVFRQRPFALSVASVFLFIFSFISLSVRCYSKFIQLATQNQLSMGKI